jgi:peroxygenase
LTSQDVIVEGARVYADINGDKRIAKNEEIGPSALGSRYDVLIEATRFIERFCDTRVPGITNADGTIVSGARLNATEQLDFESGDGTPETRTRLFEHLSFFDQKNSGTVSPGDNYRGWRSLGFGVFKSLQLAAGSAAVFGRRHGGTVIIAEIGTSRPSGATGIYDRDGNIDEARWAQFRAAFERTARSGVLTQDDAKAVLAEQVTLGTVPRRQFGSLYAVCEKMNGTKTITIDQMRSLYDGSLLYRAASLTDDSGRRRLRTS